METGRRCVLVFLFIWCGGLTLTVIVMATMLTTLNQQQTQVVSTLQPTMNPSVSSSPVYVQPGKTTSSAVTYIQLSATCQTCWVQDSDLSEDLSCGSHCPLHGLNDSIHCRQEGLYWLYVHVSFGKQNSQAELLTVGVKKNAVPGIVMSRELIKVTVPASQQTVFMMKIVSLQENDSISISINGTISHHGTYWGMVQIHGTP